MYARARQEAWWRLRNELRMSFPAIGKLHGFDRSTVIHGVRQHAQRIAKGTTASDRGAEAKRHSDPSEAEGTGGAQPTETGRAEPVGLVGEAAGNVVGPGRRQAA